MQFGNYFVIFFKNKRGNKVPLVPKTFRNIEPEQTTWFLVLICLSFFRKEKIQKEEEEGQERDFRQQCQ